MGAKPILLDLVRHKDAVNLGRSALTSRLGNLMEKAYVRSSVSYPLGTQTTKWDESQSLSKYDRAHVQADTRFGPAGSGDSGRLTDRLAREGSPLSTWLAACPAPGEGESRRGGDRRYLEILHFLRPASSATAAATPGAFLFFFTGIFRLPRQGRQGGRGGVSRSAAGPAAPAPARQGPQRRSEARPRPGSPL